MDVQCRHQLYFQTEGDARDWLPLAEQARLAQTLENWLRLVANTVPVKVGSLPQFLPSTHHLKFYFTKSELNGSQRTTYADLGWHIAQNFNDDSKCKHTVMFRPDLLNSLRGLRKGKNHGHLVMVLHGGGESCQSKTTTENPFHVLQFTVTGHIRTHTGKPKPAKTLEVSQNPFLDLWLSTSDEISRLKKPISPLWALSFKSWD